MPVGAGRRVPYGAELLLPYGIFYFEYFIEKAQYKYIYIFLLLHVCILPINFTGPRLNSEEVTKVAV